MFPFQLFPLLLLVLKTSRCSLVIDNDYQKGLYLSDYCPNMQYCSEGAHVMCFYNPVSTPKIQFIFGRFQCWIGREETPRCRHCADHPVNTVEYTVEICR